MCKKSALQLKIVAVQVNQQPGSRLAVLFYLQRIMTLKFKVQLAIMAMLLIVAFQGCTFSTPTGTEAVQATSLSVDVPTWTPRPVDMTQTALATAVRPTVQTQNEPASDTQAVTFTPTPVKATRIAPTPKNVSVTIKGGNLFVHRGPSLYHNFVGVLYDGETAIANGRDRISRWIRIELPSKPDVDGWITTETIYTQVSGDLGDLPYIETEPAIPAYIRNCTKITVLILPADVQLLDKFNEPYNEEQFPVGVYQVIDLDFPGTAKLEDVNLSEGKTVDIRFDGAGEKSKCE